MSKIFQTVSRFFFDPQSTFSISIFRVLFSLLALRSLFTDFLMFQDAFAPDSLFPHEWSKPLVAGAINLFALWPASERWAYFILVLHGIALVALLVGCYSRIAALVVYVTLASILNHCSMIIHSGDRLMCVASFLLIFSPGRSEFSLHMNPRPSAAHAPWVQRILQIQLSMVYLTTFVWKMLGEPWRSGTAVYYALKSTAFRPDFQMPEIFYQPVPIKVMTWGTLALELALGIGLWLPRWRKFTLLLGIVFHTGLAFALEIPYFQPIMLAFYVLFIPECAWAGWVRAWRSHSTKILCSDRDREIKIGSK